MMNGGGGGDDDHLNLAHDADQWADDVKLPPPCLYTATQLESNKKSQEGVECLSEIVWITD